MSMIREKRKSGLFLCLLLFFLLAFQSIAFAAEEVEWTDLDMAKYLVSLGSLYDVGGKITKVQTVEEIMTELEKVDKYAAYYTEEEFQYVSDSNQGSKFGIGVHIQEKDGKIVITGFIEGKPAEKSGLMVGDVVTKIAGVDLTDKPIEAVSYYIGQNLADKVEVVVLRDGKELTFWVEPTIVETDSVAYGMIENKIGYIQIVEFTQRTPEEFEAALKAIKEKGAQCFLLDLRSCPGGVLEGVVGVAGYLMPESPLVFTRERSGRESYYRCHGQVTDMPYVVLVNERTASAAELLSGSIQDAKTSVVIGSKTYGKGLVQGTYRLPSGAGLKLTVAKYYTKNYQDIDAQKGIIPDIAADTVEKQNEVALNILRNHVQYGDSISLQLGSTVMKSANGNTNLDQAIYTKNDRAMVPLRQVVTALGGTVYSVEDTIYVLANGNQLEINSGDGTISFRGKSIDMPVEIKGGTTVISIQVLQELLGYDVAFYPQNDSIVIQPGK